MDRRPLLEVLAVTIRWGQAVGRLGLDFAVATLQCYLPTSSRSAKIFPERGCPSRSSLDSQVAWECNSKRSVVLASAAAGTAALRENLRSPHRCWEMALQRCKGAKAWETFTGSLGCRCLVSASCRGAAVRISLCQLCVLAPWRLCVEFRLNSCG